MHFSMIAQAAAFLGVPRSWIYSRVEASECDLPHFRVGRYLKFRATELNSYLEHNRRGTDSVMTAAPALIDTSTSAQDERSRNDALCALYKSGAQFVICRNKVPTTKDWPDVFPTLDEVLSQGPKDVGIVPGSVGLVVVDQDSTKAQPNDKPNDKIKRNIARCGVVIETLGPALAMVASPSVVPISFIKAPGARGMQNGPTATFAVKKGTLSCTTPSQHLRLPKG